MINPVRKVKGSSIISKVMTTMCFFFTPRCFFFTPEYVVLTPGCVFDTLVCVFDTEVFSFLTNVNSPLERKSREEEAAMLKTTPETGKRGGLWRRNATKAGQMVRRKELCPDNISLELVST